MANILKKLSQWYESLGTVKLDDVSSLVSLPHHGEWKYVENDHVLRFLIEIGPVETQNVLIRSEFRKWLPPHEAEEISEEKTDEIIGKVVKWIEANKWTYIVVDPKHD